MHGSPLSRWNNLDMWDTFDFRDFGLVGEAFLSIDYQGCAYLTDTGRSWQASNTNLRDRPRGAYMVRDGVRSTADLIRLIGEGELPRMAISVHPERWDDRLDGWLLQLGKDTAINGVKRVLSMARSHA
jgi:hypothetical protein